MLTCTFENGSKNSMRHVVVDAILMLDEKIMLIKRAEGMIEGGKWALTGGFLDRDENLEQAMKREILEETGYSSDSLKLFTIVDSPSRPGEDRQNVAFVFLAEAKEKKGEPDDEVDEAKWFEIDNLPPKEQIAFDHYDLIQLYRKTIKENSQPPILNF